MVNVDCLSYAGNEENLRSLENDSRLHFVKGNISDSDLISTLLKSFKPQAVLHFAAETHVDRSLCFPEQFIETNVMGTSRLLTACYDYWRGLPEPARQCFRFVHVSTDEVYGSLGPDDPPSGENSPYAPNSPYAASKAGSDHIVRAFHRSFGFPAMIVNATNLYGPYQFPEKFIPLTIINCIQGHSLPVYGDGLYSRDWLYVEDFCGAAAAVLKAGRPGEKYHAGGGNEKTNLEVVQAICAIFNEFRPDSICASRITFIEDRPGHDRRYHLDCSKIKKELGWFPAEPFLAGLRKTIRWYLEHPDWVRAATGAPYQKWIEMHYGFSSSRG